MTIKIEIYAALIACGIWSISPLAYAGTEEFIDTHAWCGGTVEGSESGFSLHKTIDETCVRNGSTQSSRAEYKRKPQNSGAQNMGGKFKINGGNYISLIQVLNHKSGNSGGSEPVAQLAAKRDGTISGTTAYRFYVVQGGTGNECSGMSRLKRGSYRSVKMTYEKGKKPIFKVGNQTCSYDLPSNYRPGKLRSGTSNRYYYGKLGAYNTSGQHNNSSVSWKDKYD